MGFCLAAPISHKIEKCITKILTRENQFISQTERQLGLSSSRFSRAIDVIEKDSKNSQDVVLFLPSGDMGDLILRTKMRTLSTHFSGNNFPDMKKFITTQSLNIYCAYDSTLNENETFIKSLTHNFPQKTASKLIYSKKVSVLKIHLDSKIKS